MTKNKAILILYFALSLVFISGCGNRDQPEVTADTEQTIEVEDIDTERIVTPTGRSLKSDVSHASIPGVAHSDYNKLVDIISVLDNLTYVNLGKENSADSLTPEDIYNIINRFPKIKFDYTFDVFGKDVSLDDEIIDLNHVQMYDNGEKVVSIMKILRNPQYLDMDFTGVENKVMESLRETYPDVDIQWRLWFGKSYSVRTDCERFVASEPTVEVLTGNELEALKYCTKIRFLDIGHNEITDISFVSYMPDLEAAVLCINNWSDLSPISSCTKLNYLEINDTACSDLSPLGSCVSLEHLNVCNLGDVTGWESLANLTRLERLWIGQNTNIPASDLQLLKDALPNAEINTDTWVSDLGDWRWTIYPERVPRYDQLFIEMGYYMSPSNQSYYYQDPKYYPDGYEGERTKWPIW